MGIELQDEFGLTAKEIEIIEAAVVVGLGGVERPTADLTILFSDDQMLQQLNQQFRGFDKVTDVLSFPAGAGIGHDPNYLGDIAISVPQAKRQAEAGGHSIIAELQLLLVHGLLHLVGYDHETVAEKEEMWAIQAELLQQIGAEITAPVFEDEA